MPPKYPIPKPEFFARLQKNPLLAAEAQQATLAQYATGEIGVETTVARILAEARVRGPILQTERDATAAERARRVRVQREMAENETAEGPTFVACDAQGNPLDGNGAKPDDEAPDEAPGTPTDKPTDTDHSNGDQEVDLEELDQDLNQEELDEFGQPVRAAENEQINLSEWDPDPE